MGPKSNGTRPSRGEVTSEDELVSQLEGVLEELEDKPQNVTLLRKQASLLRALSLTQELLQCASRLSALVMLSEDEWLSYLDDTINAAARPLALEAFLDITEKFDQAEADYISIAVLRRHFDFILSLTQKSDDPSSSSDPELIEFLTRPTVEGLMRTVAEKSNGLLSSSQEVWDPFLEWVKESAVSSEDKAHIHVLFRERLAIPHATMQETASSYSSFCSEQYPAEYEAYMLEATAASQVAKQKLTLEKRFGKAREDLEQSLATSDPATAFQEYIDWETDPRARNPKGPKSPVTDVALTRAVFERAIAHLARTSVRDSAQTEEQVQAYKEAEASIWNRYLRWTDNPLERNMVHQRAVRACPQVARVWTNLLRETEISQQEGFDAVFTRATGIGLLHTSSALAEVFVCKAAHQARENPEDVIATVKEGLEVIHTTGGPPDPSFHLEQFLLDWAETRAPRHLDEALALVARPNKTRTSSYQFTLLRTGVETRRGNIDQSREILKAAMQRSDLDWPEAVHEALVRLETIHGTLQSLSEAEDLIAAELIKVNRRRLKAAQTQMEQYYQDAAYTTTATDTVEPVVAAAPRPEADDGASKDAHFKRDRENTTVLVRHLPSSIDSERLESYFAECGRVREVSFFPDETGKAAMVEFRFADDVPGALALDQKGLDGSVLSITMLWRSTLFVTNFPKSMDDEGIRNLFSQYGTILGEVRWPSRKFADSRRFCYVTMGSPAAAQEALVMNGMQMEGFGMSVLISDPSAKNKRTDAINHTLFVGGLTPKATEKEVEELLRPYGHVLGVKLGWNPIESVCRGFAFVEMSSEAEAQASLSLSGTQHHGRYLKVERNDPHHASRKQDSSAPAGSQQAADRRNRSIRLHNLPEGTQEGLLQQALEKIVPLKRLEIFASANEAVAELQDPSEVGKILLATEPFVFNGVEITITQQSRRQIRAAEKPRNAPASSLSFAPRHARKANRPVASGSANPTPPAFVPASSSAGGGSQDFFRGLVQTTNQERGEKRGNTEDPEQESKRPRQE